MPHKTSAEHYEAAETLLEEAESSREPDTRAEWCLALARMHLDMSRSPAAALASNEAVFRTSKATRTRVVPK